MDEINTTNKFLIGLQDDNIVFMKPLPQVLTENEALLVAAYIVSMVADEDRWQSYLRAVMDA